MPTAAKKSAGIDWDDDSELFTPEGVAMLQQHQQAALRLREALSSVPFYAKKTEKARLAGDEMAYWLDLQGSEATLRRRPKSCLTADACE